MLRSPQARALACATFAALTFGSTPTHAEPFTGDLGHVLPGQLHGGLLANLHLLMHDYPGIAHEGWLGDRLDEWVQKGYPDPREQVSQVGLGLNLSGKKLVDVMLVARGPLRIAHHIRELADAADLPLREWAYRGVTFVNPLWERIPLTLAEISEGVSHFHYNRQSSFAVSRQLVQTTLGQNLSFGDKHGMSLTPVTYIVAGAQLPIGVREAFKQDAATMGVGLVGQAAVDWRRTGTKIQLGIELETFTPVEARLLADWLNGKLDNWKASTQNDFIRTLLHAIEIEALQNHVFLRLFHEWSAAREAVLAWNREVGHAYRQGQVD